MKRPTNFTCEPLTPAIGAEISGLDLSQPLDDGTIAALRQALPPTPLDIAAPPAEVWAVLSDASRFEEWNPVIVKVEGISRQAVAKAAREMERLQAELRQILQASRQLGDKKNFL